MGQVNSRLLQRQIDGTGLDDGDEKVSSPFSPRDGDDGARDDTTPVMGEGYCPLYDAASVGDWRTVSFLCEESAAMTGIAAAAAAEEEARDDNDADTEESHKRARERAEWRASLNTRRSLPLFVDAKGKTPLHLACSRNPPPAAVQALLSLHPAAAWMATDNGWLPLHFACYCGCDVDTARAILEAMEAERTRKLKEEAQRRKFASLLGTGGGGSTESAAARNLVAEFINKLFVRKDRGKRRQRDEVKEDDPGPDEDGDGEGDEEERLDDDYDFSKASPPQETGRPGCIKQVDHNADGGGASKGDESGSDGTENGSNGNSINCDSVEDRRHEGREDDDRGNNDNSEEEDPLLPRDIRGRTPLHHACTSGRDPERRPDLVRLLLLHSRNPLRAATTREGHRRGGAYEDEDGGGSSTRRRGCPDGAATADVPSRVEEKGLGRSGANLVIGNVFRAGWESVSGADKDGGDGNNDNEGEDHGRTPLQLIMDDYREEIEEALLPGVAPSAAASACCGFEGLGDGSQILHCGALYECWVIMSVLLLAATGGCGMAGTKATWRNGVGGPERIKGLLREGGGEGSAVSSAPSSRTSNGELGIIDDVSVSSATSVASITSLSFSHAVATGTGVGGTRARIITAFRHVHAACAVAGDAVCPPLFAALARKVVGVDVDRRKIGKVSDLKARWEAIGESSGPVSLPVSK